ncbi:MAG: DUF4430 domain-containing protein [Candidatus Zixiibacteriota bacterium]
MIFRVTRGLYVFALVFLVAGCGDGSNGKDAFEAPDSVVVVSVATDSVSAFDLLMSGHHVEYRKSAMGVFVTAIDSTESGSGCYWLYSVNDSMMPVAADKQTVGSGDTVRWHFRCAGK